MTPAEEMRKHPRMALPRPVLASFELQGRQVSGVEVVSLGAGGFGAWVADIHAQLFEGGLRLRNLVFGDPNLPTEPPPARIVFSTLKGQSARPGFVMIGAEFMDPPPSFQESMRMLAEQQTA